MSALLERERGNMNQKLSKLFRFLCTGAVVILLFLVSNPIVAEADELYFDEEGNLYYTTHEKKASGSVRYMTIGWIIKRYDMPLDVAGQQYVIVTKTNYKPDEPDPDNDRYIYSYFKSDKDEILNAIKTKYSEWYNILVNYGDTVYIDSVMTVVRGDEQLGFLYVGGKTEGEVYFTYEGIANAREWASKESIRENFGMQVEFPIINVPTAPSAKILKQEPVAISGSVYGSFVNGSSDYDINKGIPSGENIYIKGAVDPCRYVLNCKKITAEITYTVPVPVTYILKWTDYYGVKREENRTVYRNYQVTRQFTYYTYEGLSESYLKEIKIEGSVIGGKYAIPVTVNKENNITEGTVKYGGVYNHLQEYSIKECESVATVEVKSSGYLKPTIPEGDYSSVAERLVDDIKVKSDKIVIDGKVILSDAVQIKNGLSPQRTFYTEPINVSLSQIMIPKTTKNGEDYKITGQFVYENTAGTISTYEARGLVPITVHTPVVCSGTARSDKDLNQAVQPQSNDVVLGETLRISFNDFGTHRDIKGYGLNSYTGFVGMRQVRCPFAVIYEDVRYEKDTWINLSSFTAELLVCDDNKEGEYTIMLRNMAYNGDGSFDAVFMQEGANLDVTTYGAFSSKTVRLIGKINELTVENGDTTLKADGLPFDCTVKEEGQDADPKYTISVSTVGDIGDTDYLEVDYSYYLEDAEGVLTPVCVYKVENRDQLSGDKPEPLVDKEVWERNLCELNGNIGIWTGEYELPEEYIVVPQGVTTEDLQQAIADETTDELIINGGSLIIAVEIVRYKDDEPYISYINEENAKNGYCNMWLYEGGRENVPYGTIIKSGLAVNDYYDYEVSGTH